MKLQKSTVLALYSVLEAARDPGRAVSGAGIAERYGASAHHLAKVLRRLVQAGVLEATPGVGGGYRFVGNGKRLTLMDVISLFEDLTLKPTTPGGEREFATGVGRLLDQVLTEIDATARAAFNSITIATTLKLIERNQRRAAAGAAEDGKPG